MSQRPAFWIHRSGRFWWGFWILMFLFACWACTSYFRMEVARQTAGSRRFEFVAAKGGIFFARWEYAGFSTMTPAWEFRSSRLIDIDWRPRFSQDHVSLGDYDRIFFPLWIPCLAWLILWPLWLRSARKKAGAILQEPHPAEIENS